jgi:metaxin
MSEMAGEEAYPETGLHSLIRGLTQAYLKFSGINFKSVPSNNHASPSGVLPFLLPASVENSKPPPPIPSAKLQRWAMNNTTRAVDEPGDLRYEAYLSLLDHRIRRAWVRYIGFQKFRDIT